jgi:ribonuclease P protein component
MHRRHRLQSSSDIQRLHRQGRTWRHPLAVLIIEPNEQAISRFAFSASRRVGPAVARNRAKRLLREAARSHLAGLKPGWNCLLIARAATAQASFQAVETAVRQLFQRSHLLNNGTPLLNQGEGTPQ